MRQRTPCPRAARDLAATECLARYSDALLEKAGGGGLRRRSLYRMAKAAYERTIPESRRNNFKQGDYADRFYMIIAGDIHLEQIDHILRAGDLFGELDYFLQIISGPKRRNND